MPGGNARFARQLRVHQSRKSCVVHELRARVDGCRFLRGTATISNSIVNGGNP